MRAVPEPIRKAAAARLTETMQTQARVEDAVRSGRPLDAEEDSERKLAYIEKKVDVPREIAERIAAYEDPKRLSLSPAQLAEAESLQGGTVDFVSITFLDTGRAASRSVARVAYENRAAVGTGFMVAPGLFLTNHHVISNKEEARTMLLEFNYEVDADLRTRTVSRFALDPDRLFVFDPTDDLDFALVAVGDRVDGPERLGAFGYLPLLDTPDKHIKAMFVNVIQHPDGRPKELVTRENRLLARTATTVIYGADTLKGSSGSPVFNDDWEVIALHHWGSPSRARLDEPTTLPSSGNEGIRISSIVRHLIADLPRQSAQEQILVREATSPRFRRPSLAVSPRLEEGSPVEMRSNERLEEVMAQRNENGVATMSVPLIISLRLGTTNPETVRSEVTIPKEPSPPRDEAVSFGAEALKPDLNYGKRRGYNPRFLGVPVPLPKLDATREAQAARNLRAKEGDDPFEIRYQHFSVVMNGARRLAFFTAVNIDGASVVRINRRTGQITWVEKDDEEGAEAAERWYDDSRIAANARSDQSLYDDRALRVFHRGHLVKRTDPSWGTPERAVRGQADTFHFTNCAPQHATFNPNKSKWAGVEDWITNGSDDEDMRVSVFCGPVFEDDDPRRGYIRVPRQFWKIVVRVEQGSLLATAILADQSDLIGGSEALEGPEDLPAIPERLPVEYQVTVREIEQLTGLDFGSLRDHDTFAGGEEGKPGNGRERARVRPLRKRIERFEDIAIRASGRERVSSEEARRKARSGAASRRRNS